MSQQPEFRHIPVEERFSRGRTYARLVRISAVALPIFIMVSIVVVLPRTGPPESHSIQPTAKPLVTPETISYIALIGAAVSVVTLVVSALGTASAVTLGWRADRRQSEELKLKIQQMELQIAEMRKKSDETPN
jgi:hypothetical protein